MRILTLTFLLTAIAGSANADLVFDLRFSADPTDRDIDLAAGDTALVDLFLVDTDGTSPMSTFGLGAGGARLLETHTLGSGATATFAPGAGFMAASSPATTPPGIAIASVVPFGFPPMPVLSLPSALLPGAMEVMLGQFSVTSVGPVGNISTLSADIFDRATFPTITVDGNSAGDGTDLDAFISPPGLGESVSFTVTSAAVVPEPSTMFAGLCIVGGVLAIRRRRRSNVER